MSQDVKIRLQAIDAKLSKARQLSLDCAPELRDEIDRILSLRAKFDNLDDPNGHWDHDKPTPEYTP